MAEAELCALCGFVWTRSHMRGVDEDGGTQVEFSCCSTCFYNRLRACGGTIAIEVPQQPEEDA